MIIPSPYVYIKEKQLFKLTFYIHFHVEDSRLPFCAGFRCRVRCTRCRHTDAPSPAPRPTRSSSELGWAPRRRGCPAAAPLHAAMDTCQCASQAASPSPSPTVSTSPFSMDSLSIPALQVCSSVPLRKAVLNYIIYSNLGFTKYSFSWAS